MKKNRGIRISSSFISPVLVYFIALLIVAGIVLVIQSFTGSTDESADKNRKVLYGVKAVKIPENLEFAGEKVPVENFDTRERLDMELLINTYWHSQTFLIIKKANRYFPVIEEILKRNNIPDDFKYLAIAESGLSNVVSPKRAVGFWQLMEETAKEHGLEVSKEVDERYHLEKSTEAACSFFKESYKKYNNWTLSAASFNAGARGIDRQIERQKQGNYYDLLLYEETARYIFRALALKLVLSSPAEYGFHFDESDLYPEIPYYTVEIDTAITDIAKFAELHSTNYKILKNLNPWLRENYLSNKNRKVYTIKIPEKGYRNNSGLLKSENNM
ncbi:MAG: lytic transglycosylase domain-containing protein [Bacteroidales bacterium]|nr:MAG: lytic transglycosylase domain-containing protein [Bacteroidales bacterium]